MTSGPAPKFVKRYADVHGVMLDAVTRWGSDVREGAFPGAEQSYS
jgi:3-methyl-2-oxobutanoate hydroxymethyltransferase